MSPIAGRRQLLGPEQGLVSQSVVLCLLERFPQASSLLDVGLQELIRDVLVGLGTLWQMGTLVEEPSVVGQESGLHFARDEV